MEAMQERMLALEEQADEDFEMVQLGLAVAIINHEFAASITRVRSSVRQLGQVSRRSNALRPLYESIRSNFEHLDGHLNLFTPLQSVFIEPPKKLEARVFGITSSIYSQADSTDTMSIWTSPRNSAAVR